MTLYCTLLLQLYSKGNKSILHTKYGALKGLLILQMRREHWRTGDSVYEILSLTSCTKPLINNQAAESSLLLETEGMHTTKLDEDLRGMMVPLVHRNGLIQKASSGISGFFGFCQHGDDMVELMNTTISEVTFIAYSKPANVESKRSPSLGRDSSRAAI